VVEVIAGKSDLFFSGGHFVFLGEEKRFFFFSPPPNFFFFFFSTAVYTRGSCDTVYFC